MISTLQHQFKVFQVPYTNHSDTFLNVKKRREQILFTASTNQENINLAFLQTNPVDTVNNLFISDHSGAIAANRVINLSPVTVVGQSFSVEIANFLLTDIFTTPTANQVAKPIFYQHLLSRERFNPDDPNQSIVSFQLLGSDFSVIDNPIDLIQTTGSYNDLNYGIVYNNYVNSFDEKVNLATVYYVKYTVKTSNQLLNYIEIINNISIYREATFDDIDSDGNLLSSRKTYIIDSSPAGFDITISRNTTLSYIENATSKIGIIRPVLRDTEVPWFVSISNGSFFATLPNSIDAKKYEIAEFNNQIWSPYFPYKTETRVSAIKVSNSLLKLPSDNVIADPDNQFDIIMEVQDQDLNTIAAYSLDTAKIGTIFSGKIKYTLGIRSVDGLNGFVDLSIPLLETQSAILTYIRQEHNFELIDVNFNPAENRDIVNETIVVYVIPTAVSNEKNVFYLVVDRSGKIIFSSEVVYQDAVGTDIAARMILPSGLYYNLPSPAGQLSWIDRYSVETSVTTSGSPTFIANPMALILGEVYVGESQAIDNIGVTDIRLRGGGIKEDLDRVSIIETNPESIWNWDLGFWDGYPYPGAASFIVEVPGDTLINNSGIFTRDQVQSVVEEHAALGTYGSVRYYGIDPICSGTNISTSGVDLYWQYKGPGIKYNVYQGFTEFGPFSLTNSVSYAGTTTHISHLAAGTIYYFMVTGRETGGQECSDSTNRFILGIQTRSQ